ncbi:MAG: HNH endonuclease [Crocosphaera sp.]
MKNYQKSTLPTTSEILNYWKERIWDLEGFFIDLGEPTCWVCGEDWNCRYDIKNSNASYEKAWEKAPLQRCHIIPRSLGGSNEPSNLFLMCKECHDLAPNTSHPEIFFQWARQQSVWERNGYQIKQALTSFDVSENDEIIYSLINLLKTQEFQDFLHLHAGLHRPQSGYSGLGKSLTFSTVLGLLVYYYKNLYNPSANL